MVHLLSHWLDVLVHSLSMSLSSEVTLATIGWRVNDVASAVVSRASGEGYPNEITAFWTCGVTPQAVAERGRVDFMIPGARAEVP